MSENKTVYFDNAATTPLIYEVRETVNEALFEYGNPSSLHTLGYSASMLVERSRDVISRTLGAKSIIFTASGSEANNLALLSGAEKNRRAGNRIITTDSEHPSVQECCRVLGERGFDVVYLTTRGGRIDLDELEGYLDVPVCLVSVMHTNNETGAIYPVAKIAEAVRRRSPRALVHTDCVQAFMKDRFTLQSLGADMVTVSAHKVHALKGVGALALAKPLPLSPVIYGGGQEKGMRSGTENTVGIASFGRAVECLSKDTERLSRIKETEKALVALLSDIPEVHLNLPEIKSDTVVNFSVKGIRSETLLHALSSHGIFVSSGSACSSKAKKSRVLTAFGLDAALSESAVRVSLSGLNTVDEAEYFAEKLKEVIKRLKGNR